jgi:hypothetical protein
VLFVIDVQTRRAQIGGEPFAIVDSRRAADRGPIAAT